MRTRLTHKKKIEKKTYESQLSTNPLLKYEIRKETFKRKMKKTTHLNSQPRLT